MSRDFDDIYKKIDQSQKELYKNDNEIAKDVGNLMKNQDKILKDISDIKRQVGNISLKVDAMLDILNSFTIMLAEDDLEDDYDSDQSWVPEDDDEEYDDGWSNGEDES